MKTPREIILERHQSAEAKLKVIRAEDLAACARSAVETSDERQPTLSLSAIAGTIWRETLWPWRRVWAGVAASWLVILGIGLAGGDSSNLTHAKATRPNAEVMAVLQQQEQLLTQLLGVEAPRPAVWPRVPGPHSAADPAPGREVGAGRLETTVGAGNLALA